MRSGAVEMNAANAYFWAGKIPAAQYFTTVPFGLNFQGMNAWLYHAGGMDLWDELYAPLGLKALPMGNTGVQMTGWFRKPIESRITSYNVCYTKLLRTPKPTTQICW